MILIVTMKDVARTANVSLGTVSNVLNGSHTVLEANQKKVLEACEQLGYRPNSIARALKTRRSKNIGFILPDIRNPFFPEVAVGAENAATENGYTILLCNSARTREKEKEYIDKLLEQSVDGIILFKTMQPSEVLQNIRNICCLVLIDYKEDPQSYGTINVDDYNGSTRAMQYLYDNGHRRIGFINGMATSYSSKTRHQAYQDFLRNNDLPVLPEYMKNGVYTWESGYDLSGELFELAEPPTALFSSNDLMALGAIRRAYDMGLSVPEDISVIGYDNIEVASVFMPMLTTVNQPKYEMGKVAVDMMLEMIEKQPDVFPNRLLLTELKIRQTVKRMI